MISAVSEPSTSSPPPSRIRRECSRRTYPRRRGTRAELVGDHLHAVALPDGDARVRGAEIEPDTRHRHALTLSLDAMYRDVDS